jgi:hypothetical protein
MRYENHFLPDSADGRALLKALLRCKLSANARWRRRAGWSPLSYRRVEHAMGTYTLLQCTQGQR